MSEKTCPMPGWLAPGPKDCETLGGDFSRGSGEAGGGGSFQVGGGGRGGLGLGAAWDGVGIELCVGTLCGRSITMHATQGPT